MTDSSLVIDVENLNKSFSGKPVVTNLSLQVSRGIVCGFLGPNGSGKTTTLRMLCGLLIPDRGTGTCLGFDIIQDAYAIKKEVGYMTQSFSLYHDLTAYENLDFIARMYGIKRRREKIAECIKTFNLEMRKNQLAGSLSGGWKQRLALAGCLLHEPQLLLLDEPTAGVDPKARREFWDEIHKLAACGITTLVSTHYMDEAERCTQLAYISSGHLLAQGTAEDIIAQSKMHTWCITGDNLIQYVKALQLKAGVEQVAFFGTKLHVSGKDERLLAALAASFYPDLLTWQKIQPNLEDIFIHLVDQPLGEEANLRKML